MTPEEVAAPAEEQDKPQDDAAPEQEGQAAEQDEKSESFDYEAAYKELRPSYTQATQREAAYRTIVEAASNPNHPHHEEAMEYIGLQTEEEEDYDEDEDDPAEAALEEVEGIRSYLQEREQREAFESDWAHEEDWLLTKIADLADEDADDLTGEEVQLLINAARANRSEEDRTASGLGRPDIEGAWRSLQGAWTARQKAWRDGKNAPQAPSGASASTDVDLDDAEQRREFMARKMSELT